MADGAKDPNKPAVVPAGVYTALFEGHPDGARILQELACNFYDVPCAANADAALYHAGQRSVVLYILMRMRDGKT